MSEEKTETVAEEINRLYDEIKETCNGMVERARKIGDPKEIEDALKWRDLLCGEEK